MKSRSLVIFGVFLTLAFLGFCAWMGFQQISSVDHTGVKFSQSNFEAFLSSPPNEKGDTLAGIAGSLAFLWIIVTVLLQANELSLQRNELEQTRKALESQTEYLANQDNDRKIANTDALIDAKLSLLYSKLPGMAFDRFTLSKGSNPRLTKDVTFLSKGNYSPNDPLKKYSNSIENTSKAIEGYILDGWIVTSPTYPSKWAGCAQIAKEIYDLVDDASDGKRDTLIHDVQIGSFLRTVKKSLENKDFWGRHEGKPSS